jgi:hypothetical protein
MERSSITRNSLEMFVMSWYGPCKDLEMPKLVQQVLKIIVGTNEQVLANKLGAS